MTAVLAMSPRLAFDAVTPVAVFETELFEDGEYSDDDSMSDDSSDRSVTSSIKTQAKDTGSPSSVTQVADATASSWATRPARRKRKRMSEEERKVRHREVQRQFMKRKRARIVELRKVQVVVEKELRLVALLHECEQIKNENDVIQQQLEASDISKVEPPKESIEPRSYGDLVFSVPAEDTPDDVLITEFEWSEIFDVLSDEASAAVDAENDTSSPW